jgi:NTP pyrophosphatase (non-canonical NTP hydrolase)
MHIAELQALIDRMYSDRDRQRGTAATFLWFMEEVGELASAIAEGSPADKETEFADVLAWLVTLANIEKVDLAAVLHHKYGRGCPGCGRMVCTCSSKNAVPPGSRPSAGPRPAGPP